jgi:diguanylate cyclase (GGDEF)-like protein
MPKRKSLLLQITLPITMAVALSAALYLTVNVAASESDAASLAKERAGVEYVISSLKPTIANDQENVTVWDQAVTEIEKGDDHVWLDNNLGSWMNQYFGHEGSFILKADGTVALEYLANVSDPRGSYEKIASIANPLIAQLRARLVAGEKPQSDERSLSIGAGTLSIVEGRPAIISVKPFISDSGQIEQVKGQEAVQVALQYLDGDFLASLSRQHSIQNLAFLPLEDDDTDHADHIHAPLRDSAGNVIGFLTWQPFRPGMSVITATEPMLLAITGLLVTIMSVLGWINWKRADHLRDSQEKLAHMAHNDILTGLPNRATFSRSLEAMLNQAEPEATGAVLYLDLDRFKEVNDTLGHPVGDRLIIEVGNRLKQVLGVEQTVARIGGDEFIIALPNTSVPEIEALCEKLIASIRQPFTLDGHRVVIGLSMGVSMTGAEVHDANEMIRKADIALYHAKATGRNRFAIFGVHMDELIRQKRDLERDLRDALESSDQIEVHYQPVYNAADHKMKSVEALVRWRHPERGLVSPDEFVPVAEETRMIEALGQLVMRKACTDALTWGDLDVAVNASAIELRSPQYAARVIAILAQIGFDPKRLEIELTESALDDNSGNCEKNVNTLRSYGVRFALDDFGTGFSSFGRLQKLDVDRIKIDKCYIDGFGKPGGNEEIVKAMISLAQAKGLATTAEGIETEQQDDILREMGCDSLQGYHLSKPLPYAAVTKLINGEAGVIAAA